MSIPSHMQAIRKVRPEDGPSATRLEEVRVPRPGPGEVLLKVLATSMCGTDRHIYHWHASVTHMIETPRTYGHEFCGEVADLGPGPRRIDLTEGDYVSAEMHVVCDRCRACRAGQRHACEKTRILGLHGDGCFAGYVVVPAMNVIKLDRTVVPPRTGAFLDALGNAVHTTEYTPLHGQSVAILGYGPIGAMAAAIAHHEKAAHIFILDVNPRSLQRATTWKQEVGAASTQIVDLQSAGDAMSEILRASDGGVDVVLEMSGAETAINQAFAMVRPGGHVSLLGLPRAGAVRLEQYSKDVIFKGVRAQAIIGRRMFATWDRMLGLLAGGLDVSFVVSGEWDTLERFHDGMAAFDAGDVLKGVFYPHGRLAEGHGGTSR